MDQWIPHCYMIIFLPSHFFLPQYPHPSPLLIFQKVNAPLSKGIWSYDCCHLEYKHNKVTDTIHSLRNKSTMKSTGSDLILSVDPKGIAKFRAINKI